VACQYTAVYLQATRDYQMSTWGSKHVEENSILWLNNNQCIKLVINIQSIHDARSEKLQDVHFWLYYVNWKDVYFERKCNIS